MKIRGPISQKSQISNLFEIVTKKKCKIVTMTNTEQYCFRGSAVERDPKINVGPNNTSLQTNTNLVGSKTVFYENLTTDSVQHKI